MAPPRRHAAPEETIVGLLADARRLGLSFEAAWTRVVEPRKSVVLTNYAQVYGRPPPPGCVLWPTDRDARNESVAAIKASREFFRRAYDRVPPTAADLAVIALFEMLGEWNEHDARPVPSYRTKTPVRTRTAPAVKTPVPA